MIRGTEKTREIREQNNEKDRNKEWQRTNKKELENDQQQRTGRERSS